MKPKKMSAREMPAPMSESMSMSVRKIDNGYIIAKSGYQGDRYVSSEMFSATRPKITVDGSRKPRK